MHFQQHNAIRYAVRPAKFSVSIFHTTACITALYRIVFFFVYYFRFLPRYQQRRIASWIFKSLKDQAKGQTGGQRRGGDRRRRDEEETRRKRYTKSRSRRF